MVPKRACRDKKAKVVFLTMLLVTAALSWFSPKVTATTTPSYSVEAIVPLWPQQLQEGDNVTIWINVRAGNASSTYFVNLNVTDPAGATTTDSVSFTTNATGYGNVSAIYPTDFSGQAHTNYTGTYQISASFNETLGTKTGNFFIGLTNATEYKRFEVVNIRAMNYTAQEHGWVNVTMASKVVFSEEKNSTAGGVIEASWRIPGNAAIGNYTVTVANSTASGMVKSVPPDVQTFKVVRALSSLGVRVEDASGQPLAGVTVDVYNVTRVDGKTTPLDGRVSFSLDVGNYTVNSLVYNLLFNTTSVDVPLAFQPNITIVCPTRSLFVRVFDSKDIPSEGVTVSAYEWTSGVGPQPAGSSMTDAGGNVTFSLTFGRYRLRVCKGGVLLNESTLDLTEDKTLYLIKCNIYNVDLSVFITDYFGQPIPNALVKFERKVDDYYVAANATNTGADGFAFFKGIVGGSARISVYIAGRLSQTQYLYLGTSRKIESKIDGYVVVGGFVLEASQLFTSAVALIIIALFLIILKYKSALRFFGRRKKTP